MSNKNIRQQLRSFNIVIKETDAVYGELAKQSGLSDCAFWLMYSLREADGQFTQKELCDQWVISKQTVNSALKGLEKSGYVSLISSEADKRNKYIALTDKGILFARKNIDIVFELEERAFNKMSVAERDAMIEISHKYQELLRSETEDFLMTRLSSAAPAGDNLSEAE